MTVITAALTAKPGSEKELEELLRAMVRNVQNEKGALVYSLHVSKSVKGKYFFYEKYFDQESIDFHNSTPYFKELIASLDNYLACPAIIELYEEIETLKR